MPTPAQRQHFIRRLEAVRRNLAAEPDAETTSTLEALANAYETLIADMDRIERIKQEMRSRTNLDFSDISSDAKAESDGSDPTLRATPSGTV